MPNFECDKCNDTGYVSSMQGNSLCSCVKQKLYNIAYNNSNISNLENFNFDNFRLDVYSNEVSEEKYNSNISPRENIKSIRKICDNFIENFDNPEENNLLFSGYTGLR